MSPLVPLKKLIVSFVTLSMVTGESWADPHFLDLPFSQSTLSEPSIFLVQAPQYTDGSRHTFGLPFDFFMITDGMNNPFEVRAAARGKAFWACQVPNCDQGFGKFVLIKHDELDDGGRNFYTLYAHLDSIENEIPFRDSKYANDEENWLTVEADEIIGVAGQTGLTQCAGEGSCAHLHFEVFRGGYAQSPIDPYDLSTLHNRLMAQSYPPFTHPGCGPDYLWRECPPMSVSLPASVRFLNFTDGNPGIPGDGISVTTMDQFHEFSMATIIPFAGVKNGIRLTVYASEVVTQWHTVWGFRLHPSICDVGDSGGQFTEHSLNGVSGTSTYFGQEHLEIIVEAVTSPSGNSICSDVSIDEMFVNRIGVVAGSGSDAHFVDTLDAVALGFGENAFPTSSTPPPN